MQPIYDQPTKPKRSRRRLWIIFAIASGILVLSCVACGVIVALLPNPPAKATRTQNTSGTATQPLTTPQASPTPSEQPLLAATTAPTPIPTKAPSITHGKPTIGGLYSDFVGKYSQPFQQGSNNSEDFWVDSAQTILINVSPPGGRITTLDIAGPQSWSDQQTKSYGEQFLPADASQYNAVDNITDFHSARGDIVLTVDGGGTCSLSTSSP